MYWDFQPWLGNTWDNKSQQKKMSDLIKEGKIRQSYGEAEKDLAKVISGTPDYAIAWSDGKPKEAQLKGRLYEERELIAQSVRNCVRHKDISGIIKRLKKLKNEWEMKTFSKKS